MHSPNIQTFFEDPRLHILICEFVKLSAGQWHYEHVCHPYWRLYWNSEPGAFITYGRQEVELTPNVVVLVSPNTMFSSCNRTAVKHFYVHFQLPAFRTLVLPQVTSLPLAPHALTLIKEGIGMLQSPSCWRRSLILRALLEYNVSILLDQATPVPPLDSRLLTVLTFMEEHLGTEQSNALLARHAGMSTSAFTRLFKTCVGHSPQSYLCRKRVEQACRMLLDDAPIKEIAETIGCCDRYHFSRIFKRTQGVGPSEFRRLHQNRLPTNS